MIRAKLWDVSEISIMFGNYPNYLAGVAGLTPREKDWLSSLRRFMPDRRFPYLVAC